MKTPSDVVEWRDIPGFPGYQASDSGGVRSLDRYVPAKGGSIQLRRGRELTPRPKASGYVQVEMHGKYVPVHRAVLMAFVGPPPEGAEGAHGDGVRHNNRLSNLRWASPKENAEDRIVHGTQVRGEAQHCAKLTQAAVDEMRADKTTPHTVFAERYGMTRFSIERVRNGVGYGGAGRGEPRRPKPTADEIEKILELRKTLSRRKLAVAMGMTVNRIRWIVKHQLPSQGRS
jgi:hypothetical protein